MSGVQKIFYVVNDGKTLTAYRLEDEIPWFKIERAKCSGKNESEQATSFSEAAKFIRTAFGPLADYRELRAPELASTPHPPR